MALESASKAVDAGAPHGRAPDARFDGSSGTRHATKTAYGEITEITNDELQSHIAPTMRIQSSFKDSVSAASVTLHRFGQELDLVNSSSQKLRALSDREIALIGASLKLTTSDPETTRFEIENVLNGTVSQVQKLQHYPIYERNGEFGHGWGLNNLDCAGLESFIRQMRNSEVPGAAQAAESFVECARATRMQIMQGPRTAEGKLPLKVMFGGSSTGAHLLQNIATALGSRGRIYKESIQPLAQVMQRLLAQGDHVITQVGGHSLGGGVAQAFAAEITSVCKATGTPDLMETTPIVLIDPQLLNGKQRKLFGLNKASVAAGAKPQTALAVSLDDSNKKSSSLLDLMKKRFSSKGILHLRLPLAKRTGERAPRAGVLGYHSEMEPFAKAINNLTGNHNRSHGI